MRITNHTELFTELQACCSISLTGYILKTWSCIHSFQEAKSITKPIRLHTIKIAGDPLLPAVVA